MLDLLDVVSADMKQSIAFVKKMIHTKKSQIVQLRADCAAEMVLDNRANTMSGIHCRKKLLCSFNKEALLMQMLGPMKHPMPHISS